MAGILREGPIRKRLREKGLLKRESPIGQQISRFEVTFEGGRADNILESDLFRYSLSDIARRFDAVFHVKKTR